MRNEPREPVSELEQEGIPDMEGAYPGEAATGTRWDETVAPGDEPLAAEEFGVTPAEERQDEPLAVRVQREEPDALPARDEVDIADDHSARVVGPGAGAIGDDEPDALGSEAVDDTGGRSAEETAVGLTSEDDAGGLTWDESPGYLDDEGGRGDAGLRAAGSPRSAEGSPSRAAPALGGMQAAVDAGTTPSSAGGAAGATRADLMDEGAAAGRRSGDAPAPGAAGAGRAGPMETGPAAGSGLGGPEDVDPGAVAVAGERGEGGPRGSQDSGAGDLAEAGD